MARTSGNVGGWALPLVLAATVLVSACDSAPTGAPRKPASRPIEPPPTTTPTTEPVEPPPETQPAEPELPAYLTILSKFETRRPARVQVLVAEGRKLELTTDNVQRLNIDRDTLPLERNRSLVLIIDDQAVEWLARSQVTEFVRSPTGVWEPVKP